MLIELAPVMQILEYVGERTSVLTVAPAHSPPLAMNGQQLTAPEGVFEAIPELEFNQTLNQAAEAGSDLWTYPALVRMPSRSRPWSLMRPWGCKSALRNCHIRRGVGGRNSGVGRLR